MELVLIAIMGTNRVIGDGHSQPWHFRYDLRRFKAMTWGHPLILGRRTFEALGGRPLPERPHIVMTRNTGFTTPSEVRVANDMRTALELAKMADTASTGTVFVIGGGTIYRHFLPYAQRIELTVVDEEPQGTVLFPELGPAWQEQARHLVEEGGHTLTFLTLRRIVS